MRAPFKSVERYNWWNLVDFQKAFPDEQSCYDFLFERLWPKGFVCPSCSGKRYWLVPTRLVYQCLDCRRQISLTAGTIFHKSKTPLHKWFWLMFLMANNKKGVSALNAQKLLGVRTYKSVWLMMQKMRWVMEQRDQHYQLQGTIEADESYYGGVCHGTHGRGTTRTPVLIAAENRRGKPGYAKMHVLPSVKIKDIDHALKVSAKQGSTIRTDGLGSYKDLPQKGFNHDKTVFRPDRYRSSKALPWVHILASNSKRFLLSTHHHVSPKYLGRYLSEFSYRYNRRHWQGQLFERLLYACLTVEPKGHAAIST